MKFVAKELKETGDVSRGQRSLRRQLRTLGAVVVGLALAYWALGALGELIADNVSDASEAKWFASARSACDRSEEAEQRRSALQRARQILAKLERVRPARELPYCVFLLDADVPNAVAMPGGAIGVTPQLLDGLRSEQALAMVLGHELGHHQHRHVLRRMGRRLVYQVAIAIAFGAADASQVVQAATGTAESAHGRKQEREADAWGLALVHAAYGNVDGALEFFEWINHDHRFETPRWAAWFATHPMTEERLADLRRQARSLKGAD